MKWKYDVFDDQTPYSEARCMIKNWLSNSSIYKKVLAHCDPEVNISQHNLQPKIRLSAVSLSPISYQQEAYKLLSLIQLQ